jgi:POT family proton-dependent oligopeptide transporter
VAEQMPEQRLTVQTTKKGERVILDPAMTSSRIYLYFYLMINVGALIGQITMTYSEKFVGFWLSYLLPTIVFFLCPIVLWAGRKRYILTPPKGSIFGTAWRTFKLAARGKWSINPVTTVRNFKKPGFWDNAKPSMIAPEDRPAWMTHDDIFVEELARALNACLVFCYFPLWWLTYNQINNNLTSQAAVMRTNGIPNDVLSNLDPFALIILIPICDRIIYPGLRKLGINFTPIKRMAFGFFTGSAAMVWACVIQQYIYWNSECGYNAAGVHDDGETPCAPVDINVWAQTGSYVLIAISEIFASITGLEYAFSKAPKSMRSMVMAVFLFMSAFSNALGEAFVPLSADPLLVWNYGSMAVLSFICGTFFWIQFRHLDAQEHHLNEIGHDAPGEAAKRNAIHHQDEKTRTV